MAKKRGKGTGKVVAFPKRPKDRWHTGGFVPLNGGTPTFELDGEQCSEFGIADPDRLAVLCQKLLQRKSWFMAIPPDGRISSWTLLVQFSEDDFVSEFLAQFEGLYLYRGSRNPD